MSNPTNITAQDVENNTPLFHRCLICSCSTSNKYSLCDDCYNIGIAEKLGTVQFKLSHDGHYWMCNRENDPRTGLGLKIQEAIEDSLMFVADDNSMKASYISYTWQ